MKSNVYVSTVYATGSISVDDSDIITNAPPIWKWAIGNDVNNFQNELIKKKQLVEWVEEFED